MATRFYVTRRTNPISPTPAGAWDDTASVQRGLLSLQHDTNPQVNVSVAETSAAAGFDVLLTQHCYPILANQTISGTVDICLAVFESAADADMVAHIHIWVTQGSTSTPRGTLLSDYIDATEFPTANTGRQFPQQTLTAVAAQAGDHLVFEFGFQANNATATSKQGRVVHGGNLDNDLVNGSTDDARPGWVEFSFDFDDGEAAVPWQNKWYLGSTAQDATAIMPAIRSSWDSTSGFSLSLADKLLTSTPGVASTQHAQTSGSTTLNRRLVQYFVGPPLQAGTITAGTVRITGIAIEGNANQDAVWCFAAYIAKRNGTIRKWLTSPGLGYDRGTANEWPAGTAAGVRSDALRYDGATVEQDDRLVLEVGYLLRGAAPTSASSGFRGGGTGADAQVGDTDTAKPTWIEFTPSGEPADLDAYVVSFACPAATGQQTITGVPSGEWRAAIFFYTTRTGDGTSPDAQLGLGLGASKTRQMAVSIQAEDNVATNDVGRALSNAMCIRLFEAVPAVATLAADFIIFNSDGFTLNWTAVTSGARIHCLLLGDVGLARLSVDNLWERTIWNSVGSVTLDALQMQPEVVLALMASSGLGTANSGDWAMAISAMTATAEGALSVYADDGATGAEGGHYFTTGKAFALLLASSVGVDGEADLTSFDSAGLTIDVTSGFNSNYLFAMLALAGLDVKLVTITVPASTGTQAITGVGFRPAAVLFIGAHDSTNTAPESRLSALIGAAAKSGETITQAAIATDMTEGSNPTAADHGSWEDRAITALAAGTPTVDLAAAVQSFDADGITLTWTTVGTGAGSDQVLALFLGPGAAPATAAGRRTSPVWVG